MELSVIHYTMMIIVGLCVGSFFNVLIWRIPLDISIVWPPSHCTGCGNRIKLYDNIPIVSYIMLGGRCRHCKARISIVYPIVEIVTAATLVTAWMLLDVTPLLRPWYLNVVPMLRIISIMMLIPMAVIDFRHYIIPDRFTLPFLGLAIMLSFIPGDLTPVESLLGALAGGGSLLFLGIIGALMLKKGDAMGLGDVKLMAYLGSLWGYETALLGIAFGAFLGSIAGGIMILSKKLNDDHRIPFGPFLGAGTAIAIFAGEPLLKWYLDIFTW